MIKINVYDFDNTIYDGESMLDFYCFCVLRHPALIKYVFVIVVSLIKYKLCLITEEGLMSLCETYVMGFLKGCPDAEKLAEKFWKKNAHKIKKFYYEIHKEDDCIISASFGFVLRHAMEYLGISNYVCSEVNLQTGEIERLCFRQYKKDLFLEKFGERKIERFYTDSLNDMPLIQLSEKAYIVKGNNISEFCNEKGK